MEPALPRTPTVDIDGPFRSGPPRVPAPGPPSLPEGGLAGLGIEGPVASWAQRWVKPGSEVWRLDTGSGPLWLKVAEPVPLLPGADNSSDDASDDRAVDLEDDLAGERDRLDWLERRLVGVDGAPQTPHVVGFATDPATARSWLVTTEVPGVPAHDPRLRMGSILPLMEGIGTGLRLLHDRLPVDGCPFDSRQDVLLASASRRLARGGIGADAGGPAYDRLDPAAKVAYAERVKPDEPAADLVVAHGDPGLPNLLVDPGSGRLVGLVDLGRLGVSDRHRDLAILLRSFIANFGSEPAWRLLEAYGHPGDPRRLEFHVLLDDLW
jgi:aminoglycoside phosphotransferase